MENPITIALPKGRILKEALPLFAEVGIEPLESPSESRKLILETNVPNIKLLIIRPTDVPTYVQYGAADIGVSGKDSLMEHTGGGLYEPVDLGISKCRIMVAAQKGAVLPQGRRLKVATKYVNTAKEYFALKGKQVEIIKLYGSMELAPLVGLADLIVDLVDTGGTLKANNLEPRELIAQISARLIVNKASMKIKHEQLTEMIDKIASITEATRENTHEVQH
ncbi:MAG TPA: ATP phosphoribosyltransferase [Gammaproteobacteria bacterium]|jgi:ATP phosphoribosyltransferase|nr:ATP phosphoribosyltransferase [Gammaproteobacteria bacterium]